MTTTWERLYSADLNGVPVSLYQSTQTRMRVALASIPGPLVNGFLSLATEALDDDGLPHTLEHLVFLGSEQYPYKGVLDSLANRCLARGTNAWTDTDSTVYTVTTAGSEGFLAILPVFADHVLYPTLTDSGFHTEVHHVTGDGEDAGVVYCEMQARENLGSERARRALLHQLYAADCGYRSETGGIMANLRALDNGKVRAFHRQFYRPDNLCVVITGVVEPAAVFAALEPIERKILAKPALPPLVRPWSSPVAPLAATVREEIAFPADDEDSGYVMVGWRAPAYARFADKQALKVLGEYLTDSAVSLLRQTFVDIDEPYCAKIGAGYIENSVGAHYLNFSGATTGTLAAIEPLLVQALTAHLAAGIDMPRMRDVIHRTRVQTLSAMEEQPHETAAFLFLADFLYGSSAADFAAAFGGVALLTELEQWSAEQWAALARAWLLDAPRCVVVARPSVALAKQMAADETQRVERQAAALGEQRLKELTAELEAAIAANEQPVPEAVIASIPVPDPAKITFIPVTTVRNDAVVAEVAGGNGAAVKALLLSADTASDGSSSSSSNNGEAPLPFFAQFDHVASNFVEATVYLDTDAAGLSADERLMLELYLEIVFECPVQRGGQLLEQEQVVAELTRDTISYGNELGLGGGSSFSCGAFAQLASFGIKTELGKADKAVQWLREALWHTQFPAERLRIGAKKLLKDANKFKRDGGRIASCLIKNANFDARQSNHQTCNVVRQERFLQTLLARLAGDEATAAAAIAEFAAFRRKLVQPGNIYLQVVADFGKLHNARRMWLTGLQPPAELLLSAATASSAVARPNASWRFLSPQAVSGGTALVLGLAATESGFLIQTAPGPRDFDDADLAALRVVCEYLTTMEGAFWKQIRGLGLSYGYGMRSSVEEGLLVFSLTKSVNLAKAYTEARAIIDGYHRGESRFEPHFLDAAKSSVIFSVISREETMSMAAQESFINFLRGCDHRALIPQVKLVTVADVQRVLARYLVPLFDPARTNLTVVCNPSKIDEVVQAFAKDAGRTLAPVASLEEHIQ